MKSNTPIMASSPAAFTSGTPKSTQNGMRCGWISPLVLAPQMKKVPARTQNTRVFAAWRNASMAANAMEPVGAGTTADAGPLSPNAARPTSDGRSRIRASTANAARASRPHSRISAVRQPGLIGDHGEQRHEDELTGGGAGRQQADHQAAPAGEPAGRDRCAQDQGCQPRADPDHDAPQQDELPDLGHREREREAAADQGERG